MKCNQFPISALFLQTTASVCFIESFYNNNNNNNNNNINDDDNDDNNNNDNNNDNLLLVRRKLTCKYDQTFLKK